MAKETTREQRARSAIKAAFKSAGCGPEANWEDEDEGGLILESILSSDKLSDEDAQEALNILRSERALGSEAGGLWIDEETDDGFETVEAELLAFRRSRPLCGLWLIDHCGGNANAETSWGEPLTHLAPPEFIEALLDRGASPSAVNNGGESLLMALAEEPWTELSDKIASRLIKEGVKIDRHNAAERSALHTAAAKGNEAAVEWLVERGANISALAGACSPADLARQEGHGALAERLEAIALARAESSQLAEQAEQEDKRFAALGRAAARLMENGRLSVDGQPASEEGVLSAAAPKKNKPRV